MKITSHQLEAFFETAKLRSFSKAAQVLAVTQSALSQRIAHLEEDLEVTLFIRDPAGPLLTTAGELLLRHCQVTESLEQEVLGQLKSSSNQLRGSVRIAGFSSVLRSVVIPSLAPFLRAHPQVHCEFSSHEMTELIDVLRSAEADFVVLDYSLQKKGIAEHSLGKEEYGVIEGVELGLGRAVMSKHLLKENSQIKVVKGFKRYFREVTLNYFEQAYYSRLHKEVVRQLTKNAPAYL